MLTSLILPVFGLLSIYCTFYTLIQYIHKTSFPLHSTYIIPTGCICRP